MTEDVSMVRERVEKLFDEQDRQHSGFAWMYENHIRLVEEEADGLLNEHGGDEKVVRLAALLHDIGYLRDYRNHEQVGFEKAQEVLDNLGIELSKDRLASLMEAISQHGYSGNPEGIEARIVASADALSHLRPRFWAANAKKDDKPLPEFYDWMEHKIERDLDKICLEEAQEKAANRVSSYSPNLRP